MAPNRGTTKASSKGKVSSKASKPLSSASKVTKSKAKSKSKQPPAKEVKSKPNNAADQAKKNKKPEYSEEELGLMPLNMVTPVGVQKPKGKKKNKVFVDDQVRPIRSISSSLQLIRFVGEYDGNSEHGECRKGRADRVKAHASKATGGNPRGEAKGGRSEGRTKEVQIGMISQLSSGNIIDTNAITGRNQGRAARKEEEKEEATTDWQ